MRYHLIVHTALDYVEERMAAQRQAASAGGGAKLDMYLGMLYPIEQLRVYGLLTNCRVKLIAVVDDEEPKETELRALFRRLHALYVDAVSNPFHTYGSELDGSNLLFFTAVPCLRAPIATTTTRWIKKWGYTKKL